jgi:hypothetical protein
MSLVGVDTIQLWVDINDPSLVDSIQIIMTNAAWTTAIVGFFNVTNLAPGPQLLAIHTSELGLDTMALTDPFQRLRFRVNSSAGGGSVVFDSLWFNRKNKPRVVVGFDDNIITQYTVAYPYMSARNVPGTIYSVQDWVGRGANDMTLANLQTVYAAGWDIAPHTKTHVGILRHTTTGIAASQTPATSFTLNGSLASGGTVTALGGRHLVFRCAGNNQGKTVTITGTAVGGSAQSETIGLTNAIWSVTKLAYDTVTGITISAASTGAITVGTSQSQAEITTELSSVQTFLTSNGMTRAANHLAYPFGESCATSDAVMDTLGYKTGRTISGRPTPVSLGLYGPYKVNSMTPNETTTLQTVKDFVDLAVLRGNDAHICLHSIETPATVNTQWPVANFQGLIDYLAALRDAGTISLVTLTGWYNSLPPLGWVNNAAAVVNPNILPNSEFSGAVAGSPGTVPTSWTFTPPSGLTRQSIAKGADGSGRTYIDVRFSGTTTGGHLFIRSAPSVSVSSGQTLMNSVYLAISGTAIPTFTAKEFYCDVNNAGASYVGSANAAFGTLDATTRFQSGTFDLSSMVAPAALIPYLHFNIPAGTFDFTLRIAQPKIEVGALATAYVPTP